MSMSNMIRMNRDVLIVTRMRSNVCGNDETTNKRKTLTRMSEHGIVDGDSDDVANDDDMGGHDAGCCLRFANVVSTQH